MAKTTTTNVALRRAKVLDGRLAGASERSLAAALGVSKTTIHHDIVALDEELRTATQQEWRASKGLAALRHERLLQAHWPAALAGDVKAGRLCLDVLKAITALLGLNEPEKITIDDVRRRAPAFAEVLGLDPEAVVREAEKILRERGDLA